MPYLQDILKRLKSYCVPPPAELFDAITAKIKKQKDDTAPLDSNEKKIASLQAIEVAPPDFLFDNILKAIKEKDAVVTNAPAKIIPFRKNYIIAAAASGVIVVAALGIYNFINKNKENKGTAKVDKVIPANNNITKKDNLDTQTNTATINEHSLAKIVNRTLPNKKTIAITGNDNFTSASVDGFDFPIQNNDLMATFTSFNYNNLPPFISGESTDAVKVRVDKSTSITLSGDMVSMMKKTYGIKKNGKPTMRAKREKRKFDKWKKADTKFFDKNVEKNPMDPIDLAEFIF